jgi:hypothetical protein
VGIALKAGSSTSKLSLAGVVIVGGIPVHIMLRTEAAVHAAGLCNPVSFYLSRGEGLARQ